MHGHVADHDVAGGRVTGVMTVAPLIINCKSLVRAGRHIDVADRDVAGGRIAFSTLAPLYDGDFWAGGASDHADVADRDVADRRITSGSLT